MRWLVAKGNLTRQRVLELSTRESLFVFLDSQLPLLLVLLFHIANLIVALDMKLLKIHVG